MPHTKREESPGAGPMARGANGNESSQRYSAADIACKAGTLPAALAALAEQRRWVIWRWEATKTGKRTKVPYQAKHPNLKAKSTDPRTWASYAVAVEAAKQADGIGFCLHDSEFGAFDIDDCRDPETGVIDPWAAALVTRAGSYTEITVSGTGLRIIGYATGIEIHRIDAAG